MQAQQSQFMRMCSSGNVHHVQLFLACDKVNVNLQDKFGTTALMLAVKKGSVDIVKTLLEHPGHYAKKGRSQKAMPHTIVDPNLTDSFGSTALEMAVTQGHTSIVEAMLDHEHVNVNAYAKVYCCCIPPLSCNH